MTAQLIKPDSSNQVNTFPTTIFLAGTIDNGNSIDWQSEVYSKLIDSDLTFYNPRRDTWIDSTECNIHNKDFNYQVNWELDNLENCSIVFCFIGGNSLSPITLMELGWLAAHNQYSSNPITTIIICEPSFWRRGNIEILATRTPKFSLFSDIESGMAELISIL
jgi:Nucleoside 2-deoxyribosyltransferase like